MFLNYGNMVVFKFYDEFDALLVVKRTKIHVICKMLCKMESHENGLFPKDATTKVDNGGNEI